MPEPIKKDCPYNCGGKILIRLQPRQAETVKCSHCDQWVTIDPKNNVTPTPKSEQPVDDDWAA